MTDDAYESEPWFMGSMTREEAEHYLNTHATVTSLIVRNASQPGALCLSVRLRSGAFSHACISRVHAGWTMMRHDGQGIVARSVRELLEVTGMLKESSFIAPRRASTLFSADAPQAESAQRIEPARERVPNEQRVLREREPLTKVRNEQKVLNLPASNSHSRGVSQISLVSTPMPARRIISHRCPT
jgi:hypothetical protein